MTFGKNKWIIGPVLVFLHIHIYSWCIWFDFVIVQLCQGRTSSWSASWKSFHNHITVRILHWIWIPLFLLCPKTIMSAFIALWIMYALYQRSCCRFWRCHQSICKLLRKEWVHQLLWSAGTSFLNSHSLPPFLSLSMFILIITFFSLYSLERNLLHSACWSFSLLLVRTKCSVGMKDLNYYILDLGVILENYVWEVVMC